MSKPRKKWEPEYRFGGNPSSCYIPRPLGDNQYRPSKNKRKKRK